MAHKGSLSKVQLYVLGLLARYGEQHGYRLKQRINDEVADFARIELGNIYYHLGRMERNGLVQMMIEREGKRPERAVYSITPSGQRALDEMLTQALEAGYWAEFAMDASIFFADRLREPNRQLAQAMARQRDELARLLVDLKKHRQQVEPHVPPDARPFARALFRHHELHYQAELTWLDETIATLHPSPPTERPSPVDRRPASKKQNPKKAPKKGKNDAASQTKGPRS